METFNTVVGTLGLIVAIIALLHSIYYNLVKIKLSNCTIDRVDEGYDKIYSFEVSNLSNVSVMVTGIELYDKQGKLLNDTGFDPYQKYNNESYESRTSIPNTQLSSGWESYPFKYEVEVFLQVVKVFHTIWMNNHLKLLSKQINVSISSERKNHSFPILMIIAKITIFTIRFKTSAAVSSIFYILTF